jgi:hypothetical protein
MDRKKHPSGRPIRERNVKAAIYRAAPNEPLTPGLRKRETAQAIGFTVDLMSNERHRDDLIED